MERWSSTKIVDKTITLWRFKFRVDWRRNNGMMGRFGGGWNWALGCRWSSRTILVFLLIMSISVRLVDREKS